MLIAYIAPNGKVHTKIGCGSRWILAAPYAVTEGQVEQAGGLCDHCGQAGLVTLTRETAREATTAYYRSLGHLPPAGSKDEARKKFAELTSEI